MRLGDPRAGLSHARPASMTPAPFSGDQEREAHCRWTEELEEAQEGAGSTHPAAREALVSMAAGGGSLFPGGVLPQPGLPPRNVLGKPPCARSRGPKFQIGQEGVNGSPLPGFTRGPHSGAGRRWAPRVLARPAPAATPARARARTVARRHPAQPPALSSHARPRRAPRTQRPPSCLTSRTTHAPPQLGEGPSGLRTPCAHIAASAGPEVWCDFATPLLLHTQGHKQL